MSFEAKIIEDSINPWNGVRLTTFQLKYPRFIHGEVMTHRVFSRNAMSSRAIPVAKMIEQVRNNPAAPVHWGKNQPGMQANVELEEPAKTIVMDLWLEAADRAAYYAGRMNDEGAHKQVVNRILEPFQWMQTIVTATDWENFYELRAHPDAQPEFQHLAYMMKAAHDKGELVTQRMVHLPYVTDEERNKYSLEECMMFSTARCARVSYLTHDGNVPSPEKDKELYTRLVGSIPVHASPCEHPAVAAQDGKRYKNFVGWIQHRQEVEDNLWKKERR